MCISWKHAKPRGTYICTLKYLFSSLKIPPVPCPCPAPLLSRRIKCISAGNFKLKNHVLDSTSTYILVFFNRYGLPTLVHTLEWHLFLEKLAQKELFILNLKWVVKKNLCLLCDLFAQVFPEIGATLTCILIKKQPSLKSLYVFILDVLTLNVVACSIT